MINDVIDDILICVTCHCFSGTKNIYSHVRLGVFMYGGLRNSAPFGLGFIDMVDFFGMVSTFLLIFACISQASLPD